MVKLKKSSEIQQFGQSRSGDNPQQASDIRNINISGNISQKDQENDIITAEHKNECSVVSSSRSCPIRNIKFVPVKIKDFLKVLQNDQAFYGQPHEINLNNTDIEQFAQQPLNQTIKRSLSITEWHVKNKNSPHSKFSDPFLGQTSNNNEVKILYSEFQQNPTHSLEFTNKNQQVFAMTHAQAYQAYPMIGSSRFHKGDRAERKRSGRKVKRNRSRSQSNLGSKKRLVRRKKSRSQSRSRLKPKERSRRKDVSISRSRSRRKNASISRSRSRRKYPSISQLRPRQKSRSISKPRSHRKSRTISKSRSRRRSRTRSRPRLCDRSRSPEKCRKQRRKSKDRSLTRSRSAQRRPKHRKVRISSETSPIVLRRQVKVHKHKPDQPCCTHYPLCENDCNISLPNTILRSREPSYRANRCMMGKSECSPRHVERESGQNKRSKLFLMLREDNEDDDIRPLGNCCQSRDNLEFIQPGLCSKKKKKWTNEYAIIPQHKINMIDPCEELDPIIHPRADKPCIRDSRGNPLTDCIGRPLRDPTGMRFLRFNANGSVMDTNYRGNFYSGQPPLCVKHPPPSCSCAPNTTHQGWMDSGHPIKPDMSQYFKHVITSRRTS